MIRLSNLHTHTTFSDGKHTPEEMILRAIELGFSSIGISDHSETEFDCEYCMATSRYAKYQKELARLKEKYRDKIDVLCGLELDSASDAGGVENFDYVIGSVHYIRALGRYYPVDHYEKLQWEAIESWGEGNKNEYARRYFEQVADFAAKGGYEIQGHFDLVNKFSVFDAEDAVYRDLALSSLDAVLGAVPFIEVNTGALSRGYESLYPAPFLLEHVRQRGGRIVLNSDSHRAETLDSHFSETVELLKSIGFSSLWQKGNAGWNEISIK